MDNLKIYNDFRAVPDVAKKTIRGGRLNGFTDINPMWRIEKLTEEFGPCGIGWSVSIKDIRLDEGSDGVTIVNVTSQLFIKVDGEWSRPIEGVGGSAFVAKEKGGMFTSDEAVKMAYTDSISICCKMLGMAADVYYSKSTLSRDNMTKYDSVETSDDAKKETPANDDNGIITDVEEARRMSLGCKTKEELGGLFNSRLGGNRLASPAMKRMIMERLSEITSN